MGGRVLTVYWKCMVCDEHGEGDSKANSHTTKTHHPTITSVLPPKPETE